MSGSNGQALPLDRINSALLIRIARRIYYRFLESSPGAADPVGVVLSGDRGLGRVVFERPVLLIEEHFVPMEWLRNRSAPRSRAVRASSGRNGQ